MFDPNMYHVLCEQLTAPHEAIEEVIQMTKEKKAMRKRRPIRVLVAVAAVCTALAITASASNPEILEGIVTSIRTSVSIGEYHEELVMENGEVMTALCIPDAAVEEQDGRTILTVNGEELDITEELAREGRYVWYDEDQGAKVQVEVILDENGAPQAIVSAALAEGDIGDASVSMVIESNGEETDPLNNRAAYSCRRIAGI